MQLRIVKLALLFTALHAILAMVALTFSFSKRMARFDNPQLPETYAESAVSHVADIMFQPMMFIWEVAAIRDTSTAVEWLAFLLNSAFWGIAFGALVIRLTTRSGGRAKARR